MPPVPHTKEEAHAWLQNDLHSVGDALDITRLSEIYSKNCSLRFANYEPFEGLESITSFFTVQYALLDSMKHTILTYDIINTTIYQAASIAYVVAGDPEKTVITLRGFAVFELVPEGEEEAGKLKRMEVYLDAAPLAAKIGEVMAAKQEST